ncbi:MAG: hypothetical protein KF803_12025 [Cyclobacteriaceae bacterium]|nr:hypothetical protein [Cyclobacteriaceae bacterium]
MTDKEQRDLRAYCAFLLKEYGFQLTPTDPVMPALYIIHREMEHNSSSNRELAQQVRKAAEKIKPQVFHFNVAGEAWKFQLGAAVKWLVGGLIILLFLGLAAGYWSTTSKVKQANAIMEAHGYMHQLMEQVKKDESGYYYVDFTSAMGNTKADSTERFKKFQILNAKTVRVYLGKGGNPK